MIGSVSIKSKKKSSKNSSPTITLPESPKGDSFTEVSADIHVVDSSTTKSGSKEKGKNQNNQNSKDKMNKNESTNEKRKPRYPCFICDEDHFTKECPHRAEFSKFVKGSQTLAVLKYPSPTQDSKMVASSSNTSEEPIMMMSHVRIAMRSQDYGSKNPIDGKEVESSNSNTSTTPPPGSDPLQIEKPNPDLVIKPPAKGIFWKSAFNPHARVA